MSENLVLLKLEVPVKSVKLWDTLLKGLSKDELGTFFEERIEPFGAEAEDVLDSILDDWDTINSVPSFQNYSRKKTKIKIDMIGGWGVIEHAEALKKLFEVCGAKVEVFPDFLEDCGDEM